MNRYADLKVCKELYKLSGWGDTLDAPVRDNVDWYEEYINNEHTLAVVLRRNRPSFETSILTPAYDLGYLLSKLPKSQRGTHYADYWLTLRKYDDLGGCEIGYVKWADDKDWLVRCTGKDYENTACKLAIELFKQGTLEKEAI